MKIKYLILLFLILLFLPTIFLIIWNTSFYFWNFVSRKNILKNLENIFWWEYNLQEWNIYYRYGDFENAIKNYEKYNCKNDCNIKYHNLWNSYYRLWEKEENLEKKIYFYLKSVLSYEEALNIKFDEQTKFNHDFVLEKLKELQKEQENKKQKKNEWDKNNKDKKGNWNNNENNKENQNSDEKKWNNQQENNQQEPKLQPKWPTIDISKDYQRWLKKLDENEKQMLEEYLKQLKEEEKQNRTLNNKKQNQDIFDILRWQFFEDFDDWWSDW